MKPSILGRWCPGAPKTFYVSSGIASAAFSGNTSLISPPLGLLNLVKYPEAFALCLRKIS